MFPLLLLCLAGAIAIVPARAQQPSAWADLVVPGGVDPSRLDSRGKLISYRDSSAMHVFSAAHRAWRTATVSPAASARLMNDCTIALDGTTWTAFSAYSGQFEPLTVSASAQLVNPSSQNNDSILLVLDGGMLHAFSGFVGTWTSRAVSPTAVIAVQRHVAMIADGLLLTAMDAYTGQWHDLTVTTPPLALECDGTAGIAIGPTDVHGFSATHRTWQSAPAIANAQFARSDDWCLFWTSTQALAYSGVTGTFNTAPHGIVALPHRRDLCAVLETPSGFRAYSAMRNTISPLLAPLSATVLAGEAAVIFTDGPLVTAYSAQLDTSATIGLNASAQTIGATVASVVDGTSGAPWCYTAMRGTWHQAPANTLAGPPQVTANSILLQATSGAYAFSGRTGNFVALPGTGIVLLGNNQSALGAAYDATSLHAFDARVDVWRSIPRASTIPPLVQIWRASMFVIDGMTAYGYGAENGAWSSTPLPEPYANGRANSESSRVVTATHVFGHAPVATTLTNAQYPEFRRVQPLGTTAGFSVATAGGGVAILAGGFLTATPTPIQGFGDQWLTAPLATVLLIAAPGTERATFDLAVPNMPGLRGTELAFQSLVIPSTGAPHLTEAAMLYLP